MPVNRLRLWQTLDRATTHLCYGLYSVVTPRAKAGLYRRAAAMYAAVAETLQGLADEELGLTETAAMVKREYGE